MTRRKCWNKSNQDRNRAYRHKIQVPKISCFNWKYSCISARATAYLCGLWARNM